MALENAKAEFYRKRAKLMSVSPVMSAIAYADGDAIGPLMSYSSIVNLDGYGGFIHSITLIDRGAQDAVLDVIFFSGNPSASTFTDNSEMVIAAADQAKIIGTVPIAAADYTTVSSGVSVATIRGVGLVFDCSSAGSHLYAAIRNNGGTPTYLTTADLTLNLGIVQG